MTSVLVIDDDSNFASATVRIIERFGVKASAVGSLAEARRALRAGVPELVLVDLYLPDGSGLEFADELAAANKTRVALMTGHPSVETAARAVRLALVDYMVKPIEVDRLRQCLSLLEPPPAHRSRRSGDSPPLHLHYFVGESDAMYDLYRRINQIAPGEGTVLVQGEFGTGKELVARAIHEISRPDRPFVSVDCSAIKPSLISSELFGHEQAAFRGATRRQIGAFEQAGDGTLYLDEVTEMPIELQSRLLRVLEERLLTRVGGTEQIQVDARIIAATDQDLHEASRSGILREDLYHRLMTQTITLLPLRSRGDDWRLLTEHYLQELNQRSGQSKQFSDAALKKMAAYDWPGNIRSLKYTIHRAFVMSPPDQQYLELPEDFHPYTRSRPRPSFSAGMTIKDMERQLVETTLQHFGGNKRLAARSLGISVRTLYNRLEEYRKYDA